MKTTYLILLSALSLFIVGCSNNKSIETVQVVEKPIVEEKTYSMYSGVLLDINNIYTKKPYDLISFLINNYGEYFPKGIVETLKTNYSKYGTPQFGSIVFDLYEGIDLSVCFYSDNTYCKDESGLWFTFNKRYGYTKDNLGEILNINNFSAKRVHIEESDTSISVRVDL